MPSPLFKHAAKAFADQARREFSRTSTGKLVAELDRLFYGGRASPGDLDRFNRRVKSLSLEGALAELSKRSPIGKAATEISRYARDATSQSLFDMLMDAAGPVGDLIKSLVRPRGGRLATIQRELKAAASLLNAFGYDVRKKKRSPSPRRKVKKKTTDQRADDAKELLESLGYEVNPPKRTQSPKPVEPPAAPRTPRRPRTPRHPGDYVTIELGGQTRRLKFSDPIVTGEMVRVESSNVHSIGIRLDPSGRGDQHTLLVRFLGDQGQGKRGGPGSLYEYYNIPISLWDAFMTARSKGTFVWDRLRIRGTVSGHRYQYDLAGIQGGYVPRRATLIGDDEWFIPRTFRSQIQEARSELPEQRIGRYNPEPNRGAPNRGTPNRGTPNRGTPNRG